MVTKYALNKAIKEHKIATNNIIGTEYSIAESQNLLLLIKQADADDFLQLSFRRREYCKEVCRAASKYVLAKKIA